MNNELIKELTRYYHEITPEDVVGVSFGKKETGGVLTDKDAVVFTVLKKKPLDEIPDQERIPSQIEFSGVTFDTDVEEGEIQFLESCPSDFYSWTTTPPSNRNTIRPLQGGISSTNYTNLGSYVGTLGFLAVDNDTNSLVGVSNNHVLVYDAFQANELNPSGERSSIQNNFVTQPNESGNSGLQNAIGLVKKYVPLSGTSYYNSVDCALTTINESDIDYSTSYKQYGMTGWVTPLDFATTSEIDNLLETKPNLFSSGRTTGPKGEGDMKLFAESISSVISIAYHKQGVSTTVYFEDCIKFYASASTTPSGYVCTYPIAPGDSGSALVADFGGTRKIIGLVFAGSTSGGVTTRGYANRIDKVVEQMNISVWSGQTVNFSNTGSTETYTVSGLSSDDTLNLSGNTYWQGGII